MTELSFLIELLLHHELKKNTKDAIAARIQEVEKSFVLQPPSFAPQPVRLPPQLQQAPSTLAAMARHGDLPPMPVMAAAPLPAVSPPLTGAELAAREKSMELLKKRHTPLKV